MRPTAGPGGPCRGGPGRESIHSRAARSSFGGPESGGTGGRVASRSSLLGDPAASVFVVGAGFARKRPESPPNGLGAFGRPNRSGSRPFVAPGWERAARSGQFVPREPRDHVRAGAHRITAREHVRPAAASDPCAVDLAAAPARAAPLAAPGAPPPGRSGGRGLDLRPCPLGHAAVSRHVRDHFGGQVDGLA